MKACDKGEQIVTPKSLGRNRYIRKTWIRDAGKVVPESYEPPAQVESAQDAPRCPKCGTLHINGNNLGFCCWQCGEQWIPDLPAQKKNIRRTTHLSLGKKWGENKITEDVKSKWRHELRDVKKEELDIKSHASLDEVDAEVVRKMLRDGFTSREIAEETGHSKSTILRYRKSLLEKGGRIRTNIPPYERKDIPYEQETEIKMLLWRWGVYSLDEPTGEYGRERHSFFPSTHPSPVDELIAKEEQQSFYDDFIKWLRSWRRSLPSELATICNEIMYGDGRVTVDELEAVRTRAFKLFLKKH